MLQFPGYKTISTMLLQSNFMCVIFSTFFINNNKHNLCRKLFSLHTPVAIPKCLYLFGSFYYTLNNETAETEYTQNVYGKQ